MDSSAKADKAQDNGHKGNKHLTDQQVDELLALTESEHGTEDSGVEGVRRRARLLKWLDSRGLRKG